MRARLWILEDDIALGFLLQHVIPSLCGGIDVRLFETGEAALKAPGIPDIVIADTNLAGKLTGPEVVEVLRKRNPDLGVLYSSAYGRPPGVTLLKRDRDLPKPFSMASLVQQITGMVAEVPRLHLPALAHPRSANPPKHR